MKKLHGEDVGEIIYAEGREGKFCWVYRENIDKSPCEEKDLMYTYISSEDCPEMITAYYEYFTENPEEYYRYTPEDTNLIEENRDGITTDDTLPISSCNKDIITMILK